MRRTHPLLAILAIGLVLAACGGSTGGLGSVPSLSASASPSEGAAPSDVSPAPSGSPAPTASTETPSGSPSASPSPSGSGSTMLVRVYFILGGPPGSVGLVPLLRVVPQTVAVATAAMGQLLAGPTAKESGDRAITTAIPDGTQLLGLTIKNGVATVDLSGEFASGSVGSGPASATELRNRLGEVVYTLTQFSTVRSVLFQVDGQTVTVFGSAGIALDGPQTRADLLDTLPAIFVDRPAYGAALGNPGKVTGNADVFEATFRMAILDGSGASLVDRQVMASCGTGCRGTFDVTLPYTVAKAQYGTLRAYDLSAKDGTAQDIRDYPVWLTLAP